MTPVARIMSPVLKFRVGRMCRTPMTDAPPVASAMCRTGSLLLSFTNTCPVKSNVSPLRCAKTQEATSAQFVSNAASMRQDESMAVLYQENACRKRLAIGVHLGVLWICELSHGAREFWYNTYQTRGTANAEIQYNWPVLP